MTPALGSFGVVRTTGWQAAIIRAVTQSTVNHAFVFVGSCTFDYGGQHYTNEPAIVEADPSGACVAPASKYPGAIWSDLPPDGKGELIAAAALKLVGTPYSWVDDACIGLAKIFGWHVPESVRKRLNRRDRLQCAQLVDRAYHIAGVDLWNDGRIQGDCSPGDLLDLIVAQCDSDEPAASAKR